MSSVESTKCSHASSKGRLQAGDIAGQRFSGVRTGCGGDLCSDMCNKTTTNTRPQRVVVVLVMVVVDVEALGHSGRLKKNTKVRTGLSKEMAR